MDPKWILPLVGRDSRRITITFGGISCFYGLFTQYGQPGYND
jgi:hypothetical protein